jgi:hypothetical protein
MSNDPLTADEAAFALILVAIASDRVVRAAGEYRLTLQHLAKHVEARHAADFITRDARCCDAVEQVARVLVGSGFARVTHWRIDDRRFAVPGARVPPPEKYELALVVRFDLV